MLNILENYDIISCDIFDTLLFRCVAKPVDLFQFVWTAAIQEGIVLTELSPKEFVSLRMELERRARKKTLSHEVTLFQIYQEMPPYIVSDPLKMVQLEVQTEQQYTFLNPDLYQCLQHCRQLGKKIVLLSDMYLSSGQLLSILEYNQADLSLFEHIFVSCEANVSKQNGLLFDLLFQTYPAVKKDSILHIGDNKNSDVEQARKKGIAAFHYSVIPDRLNSIYDYERILYNQPLSPLLSLRKLAAHQKDSDLAFGLGVNVVGTFLTLYIHHVCDRLEALHLRRIYPLMREGYILAELLKREAAHRQMDLLVKPIYISRKVSYLAAVEQINQEEIENMIGVRNLTVFEAIQVLGLEVSDFSELEPFRDTPMKLSHTIPFSGSLSLKQYFIQRLLEPKQVRRMESFVKEQRRFFLRYLKQECGSLHDMATIDIGFFGRIQMWMQKALDLEGESYSIKHFFGIGIVGEKLYDGINIEGYCSTLTENNDLIPTISRSPDVLEKMISVNEGSTIGYQEEQGKIVPILSEPVDNEAFTRSVFQGILSFQQYWHSFQNAKPQIARQCAADSRGALMILQRLLEMPLQKEVKLLASLEADTNFGTHYKNSIILQRDRELLEEKGIEFVDRCNLSYTYKNNFIVWPKGVITLKDEYYYVKKAMKQASGNVIVKEMQAVVENLSEQGIQEIALYGAGEHGRQFYFLCQMYQIKVRCFIDRKKSLWGTQKEGIPIMGLSDAVNQGIKTYLITSLFSIDEIKYAIEQQFEALGIKPQIYSV